MKGFFTRSLSDVLVYLVLLALLVPWYWPAGHSGFLFGFPHWALASLGTLLLASIYTAWRCLASDDRDE